MGFMKNRKKESEKRKAVRWRGKMPGEFIFFSDVILPDSPKKKNGTICNFSSLGMCVEMPPIEEMEADGLLSGIIKVGVRTNLPGGGQEVKALSRVIWIKKAKENNQCIIGLELIDITMPVRDRIEQYVIDYYLQEERREN